MGLRPYLDKKLSQTLSPNPHNLMNSYQGTDLIFFIGKIIAILVAFEKAGCRAGKRSASRLHQLG